MSKVKDSDQIPDDIRKMSFEDALKELEDIVQSLEQGDVSLDESIAVYTRGTHLKNHCAAKLKDAQARIEKIVPGPDGSVAGTEPVDPE
jgi:exodeoxyribonuclease VII small subunit